MITASTSARATIDPSSVVRSAVRIGWRTYEEGPRSMSSRSPFNVTLALQFVPVVNRAPTANAAPSCRRAVDRRHTTCHVQRVLEGRIEAYRRYVAVRIKLDVNEIIIVAGRRGDIAERSHQHGHRRRLECRSWEFTHVFEVRAAVTRWRGRRHPEFRAVQCPRRGLRLRSACATPWRITQRVHDDCLGVLEDLTVERNDFERVVVKPEVERHSPRPRRSDGPFTSPQRLRCAKAPIHATNEQTDVPVRKSQPAIYCALCSPSCSGS